MVSSLIFSQSRYPFQTVIDGDSVVILTKGQADTINEIFESQKKYLANVKTDLKNKDSIIRYKDSLLNFYKAYYQGYYSDYKTLREEYKDLLILNSHIEKWILDRSKEGAWIYYSYDSNWIEAVDLSEYKVRKNNTTGDIFFYRAENCPPEDKKKNDYPRRGWEKEVILVNRPKINKL
jgi:hypothetical protein